MTKKKKMFFATVLCLLPENVYGRLLTGNGLAAGCQLFYRKIYRYIFKRSNSAFSFCHPFQRESTSKQAQEQIAVGVGGGSPLRNENVRTASPESV